ncbi:MAG: hypothetical protein CVV25_07880 [Ignavibacteriae bacterium HGW-Ignavibacteriae-4]|jgi:hypothetical protein|nr:MAG: hypothetical protein CVV25_07880 [Ignavibacteriae bacterium HGW-Ignavibacteriae-4]
MKLVKLKRNTIGSRLDVSWEVLRITYFSFLFIIGSLINSCQMDKTRNVPERFRISYDYEKRFDLESNVLDYINKDTLLITYYKNKHSPRKFYFESDSVLIKKVNDSIQSRYYYNDSYLYKMELNKDNYAGKKIDFIRNNKNELKEIINYDSIGKIISINNYEYESNDSMQIVIDYDNLIDLKSIKYYKDGIIISITQSTQLHDKYKDIEYGYDFNNRIIQINKYSHLIKDVQFHYKYYYNEFSQIIKYEDYSIRNKDTVLNNVVNYSYYNNGMLKSRESMGFLNILYFGMYYTILKKNN